MQWDPILKGMLQHLTDVLEMSCAFWENLTRDWDWKLMLCISDLTFHKHLRVCRINRRERSKSTKYPTKANSWEGGTSVQITPKQMQNSAHTFWMSNCKPCGSPIKQTDCTTSIVCAWSIFFQVISMKNKGGWLGLLPCKGANLKILLRINTLKSLNGVACLQVFLIQYAKASLRITFNHHACLLFLTPNGNL